MSTNMVGFRDYSDNRNKRPGSHQRLDSFSSHFNIHHILFFNVQLQLSPFPTPIPIALPCPVQPPPPKTIPSPLSLSIGHVYMFPFLPCCYPPLSSHLVPVSLFLISMCLVLLCSFVCFVDQIPLIGEIIWYLSFTAWHISLSICIIFLLTY